MQTTTQRLERLEKHNRRLTLTIVAMCAIVTMGMSLRRDEVLEDGNYDKVTAQKIVIKNDAGDVVVWLGADDHGDGLVYMKSGKGNKMVLLNRTADGNGGSKEVYNKTGEVIAWMFADEYDNGLVGAYNRKGRTLTPGP